MAGPGSANPSTMRHFWRSRDTLKVPVSLFRDNRERLVSRLRANSQVSAAGTFVVLQGGEDVPFNDTDINWPFRQESFFQWCFGAEEPGCYGALDLAAGTSILFVPRLPAEYAIWEGKLHTLDDFKKRYGVDEARYTDEIARVLKEKRAHLLLTLSGRNSDSGLLAREAVFDGIAEFKMIISRRVYRGKFLTRAFMQPHGLTAKFQKRLLASSTHDPGGAQLLQTTILVQEGTHIPEVPVIVRRITDVGALLENKSKSPVESLVPSQYLGVLGKDKKQGENGKEDIPSTRDTSVVKRRDPLKQSISIETDEGTAILFHPGIEHLKNTDAERLLHAITSGNTDKETNSLLRTKIADEINCRIALQGLRKIIELENGWHAHRKALSSERWSFAAAVDRDTFLRQLVNLIVKSEDNEVILQGLKVLRRDRFSPTRNVYKDWMCNEATIRAADGKLTILQLIGLVRILASYKDPKYRNYVDVLWVGLACRERDIKPDLLVPLFKSLKYFRQSKNMVEIILEKKLSEYWLRLNGSQMADILDCYRGKEHSRCLSSASKWASVSVTSSTERNLADFIRSLHTKNYIDESVEQALERYVTVRGAEIKDAHLVASIMDYCGCLKVRNPRILAECGRYFVRSGMEIAPSLLSSVLAPFGSLNIEPPDSAVFWKTFDQVLSARFADLKLSDTLDILLSCTHLERYPVEFLDKVFSSYLLNRLEIQRDAPVVNRLKTKLILFDTTMSLECKDYQGSPINIDRSTKLLSADTRIRGIVNRIYKPLGRLVGGEHKLSRAVVLSGLPLINFYISDILIHPLVKSRPVFNLNLHKRRNVNTAILIHLPEYYCWNSRHLIGSQIMRKRQMRKLGLRVACLDYASLTKLANQDDKLMSYLSQSLDSVEDAL